MTSTQQEKTLAAAAAKAGMDEKTARKYDSLVRTLWKSVPKSGSFS
jgi:hypothetical protein